MIDDMLDMARIVAGKLRLEMQPVDLVSVVLAARRRRHAVGQGQARSTVRTSLDPKTPRVLGDPERLQQIVWNLLSNAVKFTESGGAIDVRLAAGWAVACALIVSDTGHGISPEFLPFVFERFRQSDASSARRHGGLGLGLALVRELVESARRDGEGRERRQDKGATFTIDLPTALSP